MNILVIYHKYILLNICATMWLSSLQSVCLSGTVVETVRATDADAASSLNSQVKYRITTGAQDKFALNATTGVMTVAPDATFDYDVQNLYEMIVSLPANCDVNIMY